QREGAFKKSNTLTLREGDFEIANQISLSYLSIARSISTKLRLSYLGLAQTEVSKKISQKILQTMQNQVDIFRFFVKPQYDKLQFFLILVFLSYLRHSLKYLKERFQIDFANLCLFLCFLQSHIIH
ncbi:hypothetical protein, partial [Helicobacter sp. MIT 01-3238]|uniref:hypothetical protein n=1 Tax=Helicobacter sp. MIT 01-3238 TaxID=398627 RepID=UPI001C6992B2